MRRVIIESPYAGDVVTHVRYARRCVEHSLLRNEAPLASHLLYTQEGILDDGIEAQRNLGIMAGHMWYPVAHEVIVYTDYGISSGMRRGIEFAISLMENRVGASAQHFLPVTYRQIGRNP